jgi:hypothetical protein
MIVRGDGGMGRWEETVGGDVRDFVEIWGTNHHAGHVISDFDPSFSHPPTPSSSSEARCCPVHFVPVPQTQERVGIGICWFLRVWNFELSSIDLLFCLVDVLLSRFVLEWDN